MYRSLASSSLFDHEVDVLKTILLLPVEVVVCLDLFAIPHVDDPSLESRNLLDVFLLLVDVHGHPR